MRLKKYLRERDISQQEFADLADMSQTMVSKVIGGDRNTRLSLALRIEEASGGDVLAEDLPLSRESKKAVRYMRRLVQDVREELSFG